MPHHEYEFGDFRLCPPRFELMRAGCPVPLEKIPFDLMVLLLERAGEAITREEITIALWGAGTFQDLDASLNTAVRKIRVALQDSPDNPRFLQTIVGRGYRFIAPVKIHEQTPTAVLSPPAEVASNAKQPVRPRLAIGLFLILILVAAGGLVLKLWKGKSADPALVAVLPFEDLNGDPAERYFSRGVTEEVITQLGRVASTAFGVIGSSSVRSYSTSQPAPRQVAADLGALYMITGTVQHAGSSVRIAVRLTRTRDGVQIWTDAFDGPSDAILAVQQDVAVSVAHAVQAQVSVPLSKAVDRPKLVDAEAYDLYLRGRFYWNQRTEVSLRQAIDYFQRTLDRAPDYAAAYAAIADCYAALVYGNYLAPAQGFPAGLAALRRAEQLDPHAPEVFASEGYLNMYFDWDLEAAARKLNQAVAANPSYAPAYNWQGVLLTAAQKFPDARMALDHARRLDPASLPILTDLAFHLHYSGYNTEAKDVLRQIFRTDPNFPLAHFWMGRVLSAEGDCRSALSELAMASPSLRDWQPLIAAHGYTSGVCGDPAGARDDLRRLDDLRKTRFVTSYGMALIHAGLGNKEEALAWLGKAVEERSHWLVWIRLDPRFNTLRTDARFQDVIRKVYPHV